MKDLNINEMHMVSGAGAAADEVRNNPGYQDFQKGMSLLESTKTPMIDTSIELGELVVDSTIDVIDKALESATSAIDSLFA